MPLFKKILRWFLVLLIGAIIVSPFVGKSGLLAIFRLRKGVDRMQIDIVALNRRVDSLSNVLTRLETDTMYIERIARGKLGMARKNEKVCKFVTP